ncbi:hypothetical protein [Streptomyces sp. NPDC002221]|uniref:hypothetical protein n=1 Tax=Streptomyces sp. NPDC002221 TaxID=3364639 RepID=UPI0036AD886E
MTDIAVGAAIPRADTAIPDQAPTVTAAAEASTESGPCGVWGDELRARAWLWRRLGVGAYAVGGSA